jgi:hypothetical protein
MVLSALAVLLTLHPLLKFRAALERCAGEVVTDILEIVETFEPDDAQMQLVMRGRSDFFHLAD